MNVLLGALLSFVEPGLANVMASPVVNRGEGSFEPFASAALTLR